MIAAQEVSRRKFSLSADAQSADLLAMFPWIAKVGPKSGIPCQGVSSGRKACKREATFFYFLLDKTYRFYCRDHLDTNIISADDYGHYDMYDEQKRCKKWFAQKMQET